MIKQFNFKQLDLAFVCIQFKIQTALFDHYIGLTQVLSFRATVDKGAIAIKGYSALPKAPTLM